MSLRENDTILLVRNRDKPQVTLIVAVSTDGCLVSQDSDGLDSNKNWKNSNVVQGIIHQFFEFSHSDEVYNISTGEAMMKLGVNSRSFVPKQHNFQLIIFDTNSLLSQLGVRNLAQSVKKLIVVIDKTTASLQKQALPANCQILLYDRQPPLKKIIKKLIKEFGIRQITIQSAGSMNAQWLAAGVVDRLTVIVYPLLVGNNGTPMLISEKISNIKPLQLISTGIFDNNYISLQYKVMNRVKARKKK